MSESAPGGAWSVAFRQGRGERPYQEDDFGIVGGTFGGDETPPELLMVLADGMGGEVGGARASRSVVRAFLGRFGEVEGPTTVRLHECLHEANRDLHDQVAVDPELDGMGSTVVAAVYDGRDVSWLSVGDSPMWLFADGRLTRLNADHSMAPVLDRRVERGEMSREEALSDGTRHMLRSAVTGHEVEKVDCDRHSCRLGQGDYLLVASDGLETLTEEDIAYYLESANGNAEAAADALYSAVQAEGRLNQDNVTFLLLAGREHTAAPAESDRTMPALVPLPAPAVRKRESAIPLIPRGGIASLLAVGGLMLAIALTWWSQFDSSRKEPAAEPRQDSTTQAPAPAADGSQALPEAPDKAEEAVPVDPGAPAVQPRPQDFETVDPAADAPADPPAPRADSVTNQGQEEPPTEREQESADTGDTAETRLPEPGIQSEPHDPESPAPATGDVETGEQPEPGDPSAPRTSKASGATTPGESTTPALVNPHESEPAAE